MEGLDESLVLPTVSVVEKLIGMLGEASTVAGWVLGGYFLFQLTLALGTSWLLYKGATIIVVTIKEGFDKRADSNVAIKTAPPPPPAPTEYDFDGVMISNSKGELNVMLRQVASYRHPTHGHSNYVHHNDVLWIEKAIKIQMDKELSEKTAEDTP